MYTIKAGEHGIVFGCMDCSYFVRVNTTKTNQVHPLTPRPQR